MGIIDKILSGSISDAVSSVGNVIDNCVTSDEERLKAKSELTKVISDLATGIAASQRDVLVTELSGSWLQRSWRPIIMLSFGFIVIYEYFICKVTGLPEANLPEKFWSLLEVGMGGYIIGRSAETITKTIAGNLDKIPGRKDPAK